MTTTNDERQQQTTKDAARPNTLVHELVSPVASTRSSHDGNDEQTHDTYSRLGGSTTLDSSPSLQVASHHSGAMNHTALNSPEHCIDVQLDYGSSHQTENPGPESTSTYPSLGQYAAQPQTLENYTLEVWWAQSRKDGSIPFPVVPESSSASDYWGYRVPDGNIYDCGSDTGATWGGSVTQDRR
ncbi:hypothetical protein Hte_004321 [Hypoxylon texense]